MFQPNKKLNILILLAIAVTGILGYTNFEAFAGNNGNTFGYAWSENFGWIRLDGSDSSQDYGVTVPSGDGSDLTGYAWGENAGWIHMSGSCDDVGGCPGGADTYAVVSTQTGCSVGWSCLSGYAWGEGVGWIRFAATASDYSNTSESNYGVYIDTDGNFKGYAWGDQVGWVHFNGDCDDVGGCPSSLDSYGAGNTQNISSNTLVGVKVTATGGNIYIANNKITVSSSSGDGHKGILVFGSGVSATLSGNEITVSGDGTTHYGIEARYADITSIRNTINAEDADIVANVDGLVVTSGQNRLEGDGYSFRVGSASGVIESTNDHYSSVYNQGTFRDLTGAYKYTCASGVAEGNIVYLSSDTTVASADADAVGTLNAIGFVAKKPSATSCLVKTSGKVYGMVDDAGSGLTAGSIYFISTTAGKITTDPGASKYNQQVGVARSGAVLEIMVQEIGPSTILAASASDALTIKQDGAGNLVVFKDSVGTDVFVVDNSGDLAIAGNIIPSADDTYDLGSAAYRWQDLYAVTGHFGGTITIDTDSIVATSTLGISSGVSSALNITGNAASTWKTTSGALTIQSADTFTATSTGIMTFGVNDSPRMTILTDGKIGIGDTTPSYDLHVAGTGQFDTSVGVAGTATTTGNALTFNGVGDITAAGASTWKTTSGQLDIKTTGGTDDIVLTSAGDFDLVATTFDIDSGAIDLSTQTVDVTLNDATDALNFDSNTLSIDASNNRIGIGTAAPTGKLSVTQTSGELVDFTHGTTHMLTILDKWRTRFATSSVVYFGSMNDKIIDNMEATTLVWTQGANTTTSTEATIVKMGDQALKITTTVSSEDELVYQTWTAETWASYERMGFWIYSDKIASSTATTTQIISAELHNSDANGTSTHDITIQAEDQWQYEEWNLSEITDKDHIDKLSFRIDAGIVANIYIDHIRLYNEDERAAEFFVDASGNLNLFSPNEIEFTRAVPGGSLPSMKLGSAIVEVNQPFAVNVAGDVGINYDLYFAGTGLSQITSAGPLRISAGDANHAENLTLTTGNKGDVIIDIADSRFGLKTIGNSNLGYVARTYPEGEQEIRNTLFSDMKFIDIAGFYDGDGDSWTTTTDEINSYQGTATTILASTTDHFYWGCTSTEAFTRLYFDLNAVADADLTLDWEYSTGASTWSRLQGTTTTDDTARTFTVDGNIDWTIPGDWATTTSFGGIATSTDAHYLARVSTDTTGWTTAPTAYYATLSRYGSDFIRMATDGTDKFRIDKDGDLYIAGKIGVATANASTSAHIISTSEQLRLAHDVTNYSQFKTVATGDLRITSTGEDIKIVDDNLWICTDGGIDSAGCATITLSGKGHLVLEGNVYIDNSGSNYRNYKKICPTGYIWVDGSAKHGTLPGFCIMKYEAKCDSDGDGDGNTTTTCKTAYNTWYNTSSTVAYCACTSAYNHAVVSSDLGYPIAYITQRLAQDYCQVLGDGYHLVTDQEWMTIANDILWQDENWTGAAVGSGCLFRGNSGEATCGYLGRNPDYGTEATRTGLDANAVRAKYKLSNGEYIWDVSGNVWNWTNNNIIGSDEPRASGVYNTWGWQEYSDIERYNAINYIQPSNRGWDAKGGSDEGIGRIYTYSPTATSTNSTQYAFRRGGDWSGGADAGVFTLSLYYAPSSTSYHIGFRCAR